MGLAFSFPSVIAGGYFPESHQQQLESCFDVFANRNMDARVIDVARSPLNYKLLFLPGVSVVDEATASRVREYVKAGGTVVMTGNSAVVDGTGKVFASRHPGLLSEVFGIRVAGYEETAVMNEVSGTRMTGKKLECLYKSKRIATESAQFEVIEPAGAEVLGRLSGLDRDYPVITANRYGKGRAIYMGLSARGDVLGPVVDELVDELSLRRGPEAPAGVMARLIDKDHVLYLNITGDPKEIKLDRAARGILSGKDYTDGFVIPPYEPEFIELQN
ncbi:beta-galactosidase trimerization domain-containing protein [Puia sp. P3]|uniref:beta-galactosidase trimerization domain-containing protein n=1 Tax=Puia sp. P3 TaxID=3423952 RepID=UPI003D668473